MRFFSNLRRNLTLLQKSAPLDKTLLAILTVVLLLGIYGSNWGRVESWHPDQMAFDPVFQEGHAPFNPARFRKPPFYIYTNLFLSTGPAGVAKRIGFPVADVDAVRLVWSHTLNAFMFVGACLALYFLIFHAFGLVTARVLVAIFGTSAGFLVFTHFLTPEIEVTLWMLVAFYFSYRILSKPDLRTYVLAGVFTGVATATKYNGLGIGISIVVAHLLVHRRNLLADWRLVILSRNLYAGLVSVVLAFIVCNPYSVLDYRTFAADFLYNYTVTPVFDSNADGSSYGEALLLSSEIFGYPTALFVLISSLLSLYYLATRKLDLHHQDLLILIFATFGVYYLKFGGFAFMQTRFVMPIYSLLLITGGFLVRRLTPRAAYALAAPFVLYGVVCSAYVGYRLSEDPRMHAQTWAMKNLRQNATMEITPYAPNFSKLKGSSVSVTGSPTITGRTTFFAPLFAGNAEMTQRMHELEGDRNLSWYSCDEFLRRRPDYVVIDSLYYQRFLERISERQIFPHITRHFEKLLNGGYPYRIVFDENMQPPPWWVYPQTIDFLENRVTILESDDSQAADCGD